MRFLLDTHAFAWAVGDPILLSHRALSLISDSSNELLVSPASVWEMSIKHAAGKWPEVAPFMDEKRFDQFCKRLGVGELPIHSSHARQAGQFASEHKDPFDRMLAAQAMLEGLTIVSKDRLLDQLSVPREW
ncbi:MAG: type II toxin-antitoxin system VapC family toxin [Trueperaceae bacterium]